MDANGRPSTILLKSPNSRYDEARAAGAIKPGHLIIKNGDGNVVVHATAAGAHAAPMFATEEVRVLEGKTKDDAYASGDLVSFRHFLPGDELQGWLEGAANVQEGDPLESAGDGTLQARTTGAVVAYAAEDMNLTALPAALCRIRVA